MSGYYNYIKRNSQVNTAIMYLEPLINLIII
jgi:hypothetical protein